MKAALLCRRLRFDDYRSAPHEVHGNNVVCVAHILSIALLTGTIKLRPGFCLIELSTARPRLQAAVLSSQWTDVPIRVPFACYLAYRTNGLEWTCLCVNNRKAVLLQQSTARIGRLLTRTFARGLSFGHLFCHLRFDRVQVKARAALHRRVIEERLEFLTHHLLD
jgi:hypothetical protein